MELSPEEHVKVQAAVQRWTDSAISKTVNAPENYTLEQTKKLYELMYDLGCKGGTIYRDGSRDEQILAVDHNKLGKDAADQVSKKMEEQKIEPVVQVAPAPVMQAPVAPVVAAAPVPVPIFSQVGKISPRKRPDVMHGSTYKITTAYGNL